MTTTDCKPPATWAILIGIQYYKGRPLDTATSTLRRSTNGQPMEHIDLNGCINDILAIEEHLRSKLGLDDEHTKRLLAPVPDRSLPSRLFDTKSKQPKFGEPTYENIVKIFKDILREVAKGDIVYVHYSGHGARGTTVFPNLKHEQDAKDELLVPSDIYLGGKYLRDLELGLFLQRLVDKLVVLTVVLDCCHSGGAVRGSGEGLIRGTSKVYQSHPVKDLPSSAEDANEINRRGEVWQWMQEPQGFIFLAACLEDQTAAETDESPEAHGLLTDCLMQVLRGSVEYLSAQRLYERICPKVELHWHRQTPYLVGDKERDLFGKDSRVHESYIVEKASLSKGRDDEDNYVTLSGGRIHGVVQGSVFAILPSGSDVALARDPSKVLALFEVAIVRQFNCDATLVSATEAAWEGIRDGCLVVLQSLPLKGKRSVKFSSPDTNAIVKFEQDWNASYKDNKSLRLDNGSDAPFFNVTVDGDGNYQIEDLPGEITPTISQKLAPLSFNNSLSDMALLIRRLEHVARFNFIRGLQNRVESSSLLGLVTIKPQVWPKMSDRPGKPGQVPRSKKVERAGLFEVKEETWFELVVENKTTRDVGFVILGINPQFGVKPMFPSKEPFYKLKKGEIKYIPTKMYIPQALHASAEEGHDIVDTIKLFATYPERALYSLELRNLEDMERGVWGFRGEFDPPASELKELLQRLSSPRRGGDCDNDEFEYWDTAEFRMHIRL